MARGIMADKGVSPTLEEHNQTTTATTTATGAPAPPSPSPTTRTTAPETANSSSAKPSKHSPGTVAQCSCSCTNISTMQLFHEMKQKFPTVPDNVVCECVGQNCHNISACIDCLEDYPNTAKMYPQALRNQPTKKKTKKSQMGSVCDKQSQSSVCDAAKENVRNNENISHTNVNGNSVQVIVSQQSNILNLTNLNCCTRPVNRPTRQAPPPPTSSTTTTVPAHKSQPLNLSVNVIVTPASSASLPSSSLASASASASLPSKSQQPHSHCSFTITPNHRTGNAAINPTINAHSSVDGPNVSQDNAINGPCLRYTSSAFDNETGYQSRFEITVAGTNANTSNQHQTHPMTANQMDRNSISLKRTCEMTTDNSLPSVIASSEFLEETETVHHQVLCKQKLVLELEKDQKRLERMQRELQAIQAPLPDGGLEALTIEIEKLRNDCHCLAQYVEEAGPSYALGETNEAFYRNIYTGQQLPMQQRQPLRPHRPAPIPDFRLMQNQGNAIGADSRFTSTSMTPQSPRNPHLNETNGDTGWICDLCTFQNKYTQQTCEACTKPFLSAGNQMGFNNNNNGFYVQSPAALSSSSLPVPVPVPAMALPLPLTHYMPMPMHSLPYAANNNNHHITNNHNNNNINPHNNINNMPYIYYQPTSLPPQFYPTASPLTDPQSMHTRF